MNPSHLFSALALRIAACFTLALVSTELAQATHFRYGHITWKARPDIATNTAEITLYASFRRSGYGALVVGSTFTETVGATSLNFGDGMSVPGTLTFKVLAFDPAADWVYAVALNPADPTKPITHTYGNQGPWTANIDSCCRISTLRNAPDGRYRVAALINFSTDVSSAVATVPTIVNCVSGATCSFGVTAGDSDGDTLFWRLSTAAENGGMPNPAGFTINSSTGQVTWATGGLAAGLYGTQIAIESRTVNGAIKSQVAVDFLLSLGNAPPAGSAPTFANPALTCGQTLDLVVNKPFTFVIRAIDSDVGDTVSLNSIGLPTGATMTPGLPAAGNPIQSVFNWTPAAGQIATVVVIFTATDSTTRQTQCNVILQVRGDRDGDGLPDLWETNGYTYNGVFVDLPAMGANPDHKDIFVEIDYMVGLAPKAAALAKVVAAFAAVPNAQFAVPNPDGANGITLHLTVGNSVPFQANLGATAGGAYNWAAFETLKAANFQPQLQLAYHYALFVNIGPTTGGAANSGISRGIPSNDFIVALGTWPGGGTVDEQAGTFMHEFGHNLGLGHGGPVKIAVPDGQVNVNYKPNYLSVMNYSFQMSGLRKGVNFGTFDYSRMQLPDLNEASLLNENLGLNSALANGFGTVWYCGAVRTIGNVANGPLDWNCDTIFSAAVAANINKGAGTLLKSYNDWANISFTGGTIGAGAVVEVPLANTPVDALTITDSQTDPPAPPSSLAARLAGSTVRLAWNPLGQTGEITYRIYRKTGAGSFASVGTTSLATFTESLATGTYQYQVTGTNGFSVESAPSNTVTVVVP